jgi:cell division protein FtsL
MSVLTPHSAHLHEAVPHKAATRLRVGPRPQSKRALRLVAPVAKRARRTPFVVVLLAIVGSGLVGLILISTAMQAQTFELAELTTQARELETRQEALQREVSELESPENLGPLAVQHGMVPSQAPVYLQLSDGTVRGSPKPAEERSNIRQVVR